MEKERAKSPTNWGTKREKRRFHLGPKIIPKVRFWNI